MQHEFQSVPVTALAIYRQKYILAGEGTYLTVYDAGSTCQCRIEIFPGQAIHGIAIHENGNDVIALWGGPYLRTAQLSLHNGSVQLSVGETYDALDWILNAAFAPSQPPLVGIVTAHNALLALRFGQGSFTNLQEVHAVLESHEPGSNCILYSAHITWLSASQCLVASGTAFGDVIVWSVILGKDDPALSRKQTHYCFSAHEGSVFGVQISSELESPVLDCKRLLVSCSDDRSIRLWDITDLKRETHARLHQDTGFQNGPKSMHDDDLPRCVAKAMGHISRIWLVQYSQPQREDELLRIQSFGEDASVITWALKSSGSSIDLHSIDTMNAHAGKHIWSLASDSSAGCLITGGADGSIAVAIDRGDQTSPIEIPQPTLQDSNVCDNFRAYAFLDHTTMIATTDRGRVVRIDLGAESSSCAVRELLSASKGLHSYSVISAASSIAFIGGVDGAIYACSHPNDKILRFTEIKGKISGLFAHAHDARSVVLLAVAVNTSTAKLLRVQQSSNSDRAPSPDATLDLELPRGFITVSFKHHSGANNKYAILGSRTGSIAIYAHSWDAADPLSCSWLVLNCHGKEAVTALHWTDHARGSSAAEKSLLFSTGRDGTFAVHAIDVRDGQIESQLVHKLELPFGPNIEGLHISATSNPWVWGFRSKNFVVYDLLAQREIMTVDCGGVHRNWRFQPSNCGGRFVWTKASRLYQAVQLSVSHTFINPGGHGREIKAMAIADEHAGRLIATGAEDTNIKLFSLGANGFQCVQTLRKHNTGIQHLAWHGTYLFSSGGFEEFFIWRIRLNIPHVGVGVVCESANPRSGGSDLRIMGFDVDASESEVEGGSRRAFTITMAYSDSTLKQWRYGPGDDGGGWKPMASGDYLTSCLTHVFRLAGRDNGEDTLWTAATDGYIAKWDVESSAQTLRWSKRYKIHQSAVHDLTYYTTEDGGAIIATAGDDNAMGITRVDGAGDVCTLLIPRAHAAAVTALATVWRGAHGCLLASVGMDQRVKLWRVTTTTTDLQSRPRVEAVDVEKSHGAFTAVADASSLGLCSLEDGGMGLLVGGVGLQLWRLSSAMVSGGRVGVVDDV